jgi:Ca2+-binding EF-hand superfamily protein
LPGNGLGPFSFMVRVLSGHGGMGPKGVPPWFKELDADHDGQISLHEWRKGRKKRGDFRKYDRNGDGFITVEEVADNRKQGHQLGLRKGQVIYRGALEEEPEERYRGKKTFQIFTLRLEKGKTYQIEQVSEIFYSYVYLEDPDGEIVGKSNSGGRGRTARILHRAAQSGMYRIIASSQDGYKPGPFSLSVRTLAGFGPPLPKEFPPWFRDLDTDMDGQVSLDEWRKGGKRLSEFRKYDLNGDGFITVEEVLRYLQCHPPPPKKGPGPKK